MGRGPIEVAVYKSPRSAVLPASHCEQPSPTSPSPGSVNRLAGAVAAALLSLVLHGLLVSSMFCGAGFKPTRPRDTGTSDKVVADASADGALHVFIVQDPSIDAVAAVTSANTMAAAVAAIVAIPFSNALSRIETFLPEVSVEAASPVATASPDAAERSAMYGRYVGQIDARIERAWLRPAPRLAQQRYLHREDRSGRSAGTHARAVQWR